MTNLARQTPADTVESGSSPAEVTSRLLNSAVTVFAERGFEAATVADIARRSGLSTGAIYARWLTKRELFIAVIEHTAAQRMEKLATGNASGPAMGEQRMGVGADLLQFEPDASGNLWTEACVSAARDQTLRVIVGDLLESEANALTEIAAEAKSAGVFDPALSTDAIVLLFQAVDLGFQFVRRVQAEYRDLPSDHDMDELMLRFFGALAPMSANGQPAHG